LQVAIILPVDGSADSGLYEEFCLLGYKGNCCLLHAGFLLGLFFNPEEGGDIFLQNTD
jgi:hypothetical protein